MAPLTVHTEGVLDDSVTVSPESELATSVVLVPTTWAPGDVKVMVWPVSAVPEADSIVKDTDTGGAAL